MKNSLLLGIVFSTISFSILAQETFPVNGVADDRVDTYALKNAVIYQDHQTKLEGATLMVKDGLVVAIGSNINIPSGTVTYDLKGKYIYPAVVDIHSSYGLPPVEKRSFNFFAAPQIESSKDGAFAWNQTIRPETDATKEFKIDNKTAENWRKQGFGAVLSHVQDGIARGSSVLVTFGDGTEQNVIIKEKASAHYSFDRGSSGQNYPTSIMGSVALLRQTYYDADWYKSPLNTTVNNQSLKAFLDLQSPGLPQIFDASHKLNVLLADKIGDEFKVQYIIKGAGDEYQRISEIKKTGASLIIPIDYPEAYKVDDPLTALDVSLADMKHWELAPTNPAILERNGINFAITADGLKKPQDFWSNLRKAVSNGLTETAALKSITSTPASMINASDKVGSLRPGRLANFFISSGNIFSHDSKILQTWIQGRAYEVNEMDPEDFSGNYDLKIGEESFRMEISGKAGSHKAKVFLNDTLSVSAKSEFSGENVSFSYKPQKESGGSVRITGWKQGINLKGTGQMVNGTWINWTATYSEPIEAKSKEGTEDSSSDEIGNVIYPFVAYGQEQRPQAKTYLIKNATVWTNETEGIIQNSDVLVRGGKIIQIGSGLSESGAIEIDGTGKHLTSGIIDEHSHVALRGVNEASEAITAEVRMYDAIDSEDVDIYRQLAGGVTVAQLLHGSANPVGGQSAIVKFRWGTSPDEMRIQGADEYIKFALGENVKQSNRPRVHNVRFPQTRMGVEQVFVDGFTRAKEYDQKWKKYNSLSSKIKANTPKPRKDLELEALAQIVNKERFITCHSYVQSEINMLMKVAESFDFNVNTFTHILEGYKVADIMKEHGAGGSTFADWWAYKWEVKEAIPYNPALMNMVGVVTAINSDDGEMARRLNQEAAKSVMYADMPEEEAWKMVTLNPAKLLHLDDRMGSIKAGKDADLVLWNDHPLSIYAKPEKTMVDGIIYYDLAEDEKMREEITRERARLIAKMQNAKSSDNGNRKPKPKSNEELHCEDLTISNDYSIYKQ